MNHTTLAAVIALCFTSLAAGQAISVSDVKVVAGDPKVHHAFPRLLQAKNGDLLLTYRVGSAHAASDAFIALRRSTDGGKTWSGERNICDFGKGTSAQNVIMLVVPRTGRIIAWVSRYHYVSKGHERIHQVWAHSDDHGATWSAWAPFDASTERSSYYMTDAIALSDGSLLAVDAAFPPTGAGNCFAQAWRSEDDGRTWNVAARLTEPAENLGDEVGLIETRPGEVLCLLRDRRGQGTWRLKSTDGGRTWSEREDIRGMVGVFQRPLLTLLDERTILATGRDRATREVVAYLSRDNGSTFGERTVIESYQADGAYTGVFRRSPTEALVTWYSDRDTPKSKPDIKTAELRVKR